MYKKIILVFILSILGKANAQSIVDGKYNSTFGNISMTTEFDKEFPNGSLIYGDYRENGTISGYYADFQKEIKGTFFNGSSEGKYIFILPFTLSANKPISAMNGFWGYNSDNKNDTNPSNQWNITAKIGTPIDIKNVTNVWSGTWNTTDGKMHLVQVGKNITGRYKGVGTVEATYNPSTRILKGTFTNNNFNKTGYIEFYFEGNTFKGKWGWTTAMTEGNWDGTKDIKNNKELSKAVSSNTTSTTSSSQTSTAENQSNTNKDVDNNVKSIKQGLRNTYNANTNRTVKVSLLKIIRGNNFTTRLEELYGFAGIEVYKVTNSGSQLLKSFGNKDQYFFNTTENSAFPGNIFGIHTFSNQPNYVREYQISVADWNNPNVRFEVRLWHHIKGKIYGPNRDYEKYSETYNLNTIGVDRNNKIWVGKDYKNGENTDSILDLDFKNSRALFKVEVN
jgi:hypothetical protein